MKELELMCRVHHDVDAASCAAAAGTLITGIGVWFLAKHFKIAQRLAMGSEKEIEVPIDPGQKAALYVCAALKQLEDWRKNVWEDSNFLEGNDVAYIDEWARKNRINGRFNYNKYGEEVYRLILCISGHMIGITRMEAGIPDYIKNKGLCSPLALAFDLLTWHTLEATASEDSPFFLEDDKLKDSDIKYLERAITELSGFLEAVRENMANIHDYKSGVLVYLAANDFITVNPLYKMKKSKTIEQSNDFINPVTKEMAKYMEDIPTVLIDGFYKRLRKNLEEPCRLSHNYMKRKEILETAQGVKSLVECFKETTNVLAA